MNFIGENEAREQNYIASTVRLFLIKRAMPHPLLCQQFVLSVVCFDCSFFMSVVEIGEQIEKSQWWPQLKDYFHMANWILNYTAGVTTQPANC